MYVEEVAARLGLAAHIDSQSFRAGEDFRDAITRTLDDSQVFVFFVSESSLLSTWCAWELEEAQLRSIRRTLRRSMAIFIDGAVDPEQVPRWLRQGKIIHAATPGHAARAIQGVMASPTHPEHPLLGRGDELARVGRRLHANEPNPRVIIASGLIGIGKRSFLRRLADESLNLAFGPELTLLETSLPEDLYLQAISASSLLTPDEAKRVLDHFRSLPEPEQAEEIARQLAYLAEQDTLPCIVDEGAMLDADGAYTSAYALVIDAFAAYPGLFLGITHQRSPGFKRVASRALLVDQRLRALHEADTQALIGRLLREEGLTFTSEHSQKLASAAGGYPPAAYHLVSQAERYGAALLVTHRGRLDEFHARSFAGFIDDLGLDDKDLSLLSYLAHEEQLSLEAVAIASGQEIEQVADLFARLVDLNVIEEREGEYAVSAPIQRSMRLTQPAPKRSEYVRIFQRLEQGFWSDSDALPPLSVVDSTLRAGFKGGKTHNGTESLSELVRPSLLVDAAWSAYHDKQWDTALEYADRAERMAPPAPTLLELRIRAYAQQGRFAKARAEQKRYRKSRERRRWYLDGFIARKEGDHHAACELFQRGHAGGDHSVSLLRDYGDSLFRVGAYDDARNMAQAALRQAPRNLFLLDLIARIEIASGSTTDAEAALTALELADTHKQFILRRRATYLLVRKGSSDAVKEAISLAQQASNTRGAPLSAYVLLAKALTAGRRWSELGEVKAVIGKRTQPKQRSALLTRLDCEKALKEKNWRGAERLIAKGGGAEHSWLTLQLAALDIKSQDPSVLAPDRADAASEAKSLRNRLGPQAAMIGYDEIDLYD